MTDVVVECYAGCRYPERPRAFVWEDEWMTVAEIEQEWRTSDSLAFCVCTVGGCRFTLAYDETADAWEVQSRSPLITERS